MGGGIIEGPDGQPTRHGLGDGDRAVLGPHRWKHEGVDLRVERRDGARTLAQFAAQRRPTSSPARVILNATRLISSATFFSKLE